MISISTVLLLFACSIQPAKALNTANGRGLYRINGGAANTNAVTVSKYRRRETSRDLLEEDNQAMFRMLNVGWEMEAYGSLSMSFSMSFSMSLSMPSSASSLSPTTTRLLVEVEPIDVQITVRRRRLSVIDEQQQPPPQQQESSNNNYNHNNLDGQAMIHLSFAFVAVLVASVLVMDLVKRKRSAKSRTFHDHQLIIASSHSS